MSKELIKESKVSSAASKASHKRSGKKQNAIVNPYGTNNNDNHDDDDTYFSDDDHAGAGSHLTFINFKEKDMTFNEFVECLSDKHARDEAIEALNARRLKPFTLKCAGEGSVVAIHSHSGVFNVTPAMAEELMGGVKQALGFGGGGGRRGGGKASSHDSVPSDSSVIEARIKAIECGTALAISCGEGARKLYDTMGEVLVGTATAIIKGLRAQMEDFIHTGNTAEGSVKAVVASPAGITSGISAAQRKTLSEIAGRCCNLLVKCFESLALLYAVDPSMSVNDEHESLPSALLRLANLVTPDYTTPSARAAIGNNFPSAETADSSFYLPLEASGALIVALASCCEPAQGSKTRSAILRLHRFVTGSTSSAHTAVGSESGGDDDNDSNTTGDDSISTNALSSAAAPTNYVGLMQTLITALAQAIGILGSRFPEMIISDENDDQSEDVLSGPQSPTATVASTVDSSGFTVIPLLSVQKHLVPLQKILTKKGMKGKGSKRSDAQLFLRQAAKKLGSINGSNIDSLEEHLIRRNDKKKGALPVGTSATINVGELPDGNLNRAAAAQAEADREQRIKDEYARLGGTTRAMFDQQAFDGADPMEVMRFRDKLSIEFIGFHQIYLSNCLRSVTGEGLQTYIAQSQIVRTLFGIDQDLTRASERGERRERISEAEASKNEEMKERKKERESKQKAREYSEDY